MKRKRSTARLGRWPDGMSRPSRIAASWSSSWKMSWRHRPPSAIGGRCSESRSAQANERITDLKRKNTAPVPSATVYNDRTIVRSEGRALRRSNKSVASRGTIKGALVVIAAILQSVAPESAEATPSDPPTSFFGANRLDPATPRP